MLDDFTVSNSPAHRNIKLSTFVGVFVADWLIFYFGIELTPNNIAFGDDLFWIEADENIFRRDLSGYLHHPHPPFMHTRKAE